MFVPPSVISVRGSLPSLSAPAALWPCLSALDCPCGGSCLQEVSALLGDVVVVVASMGLDRGAPVLLAGVNCSEPLR